MSEPQAPRFKEILDRASGHIEPLPPRTQPSAPPADEGAIDALRSEVTLAQVDEAARQSVRAAVDTEQPGNPIDQRFGEITVRVIEEMRRKEDILEEEIQSKLDQLRRVQKTRRGFELAHAHISAEDDFIETNALQMEFVETTARRKVRAGNGRPTKPATPDQNQE